MKYIICKDYKELSCRAADEIAGVLAAKPNAVLGLATGSTPEGLYAELCRRYAAGEIDFSQATGFNLDEYYPIRPEHPQSYHFYMDRHLFLHVNFDRARVHIPDGSTDDPEEECAAYDAAIEAAGGIDLQILGIGQNGHIGFNEPAPALIAGTHPTALTESTLGANARFFAPGESMPHSALTMGMAPILRARKILLLVSGAAKRSVMRRLREGTITTDLPASLLLTHPDTLVLCDREAYPGD